MVCIKTDKSCRCYKGTTVRACKKATKAKAKATKAKAKAKAKATKTKTKAKATKSKAKSAPKAKAAPKAKSTPVSNECKKFLTQIAKAATQAESRKLYLQGSRKCHPDKGGSDKDFQCLTWHYNNKRGALDENDVFPRGCPKPTC